MTLPPLPPAKFDPPWHEWFQKVKTKVDELLDVPEEDELTGRIDAVAESIVVRNFKVIHHPSADSVTIYDFESYADPPGDAMVIAEFNMNVSAGSILALTVTVTNRYLSSGGSGEMLITLEENGSDIRTYELIREISTTPISWSCHFTSDVNEGENSYRILFTPPLDGYQVFPIGTSTVAMEIKKTGEE